MIGSEERAREADRSEGGRSAGSRRKTEEEDRGGRRRREIELGFRENEFGAGWYAFI